MTPEQPTVVPPAQYAPIQEQSTNESIDFLTNISDYDETFRSQMVGILLANCGSSMRA